jgi:hypothetical protein
MGYGVVIDVPASWDTYERVAAALAGTPPGMIVHAAGPTDEGFRVIDVWESEEAWRSFTERLLPLLGETVDIDSIIVRGNRVQTLQTHETTPA